MIKLEDVSIGYGYEDIVKNISMKLENGKNLCIIGPNGCGKTTLLKGIAGILPCTGNIKINGNNIRNMKREEIGKEIGVMSQISTIYFSYTVFETVLLGRYLYMKDNLLKSPSKEDKEYVMDCLQAVGLKDLKDAEIGTLSGGQIQRVFLARTLAQNPNMILLDEPTNHLDLRYQKELIDYLKEWSKRYNKSVIGVFHDINLAIELADKILILKDGRNVAYGEPQEVIRKELLNQVYEMDIVGYMVESLKQWEGFLRYKNER